MAHLNHDHYFLVKVFLDRVEEPVVFLAKDSNGRKKKEIGILVARGGLEHVPNDPPVSKHRIVQVGVDLVTAEQFKKMRKAGQVDAGDLPGLEIWRRKV
jgi:hypothetical protein